MPASYTSGQPSYSCRHSTCWASSQRSHTVSSTPCHGAWTPAPLSAHRVGMYGVANQDTLLHPTHQFIWQQKCGALGGITDRRRRVWRTLRDSVLSCPTLAPTLLEWPFQKQRGSGLTASTLVSDVPGCADGVWLILRLVSVAQNKPSTMLSFNVQSIDPWTAQPGGSGWTMRQPNARSTPAPKSSAAKQWIVTTRSQRSPWMWFSPPTQNVWF